MRLFALFVNILALVILVFVCHGEMTRPRFDDGMEVEEWLIPALIFAYIGINIIALRWGSSSGGWLWLYVKRKTLEEKKKIEALEKQGGE
jgi:hypothetical protein